MVSGHFEKAVWHGKHKSFELQRVDSPRGGHDRGFQLVYTRILFTIGIDSRTSMPQRFSTGLRSELQAGHSNTGMFLELNDSIVERLLCIDALSC